MCMQTRVVDQYRPMHAESNLIEVMLQSIMVPCGGGGGAGLDGGPLILTPFHLLLSISSCICSSFALTKGTSDSLTSSRSAPFLLLSVHKNMREKGL